MSTDRPTPADLRDLAAAADALAERIAAVQTALRAGGPAPAPAPGSASTTPPATFRRTSRGHEATGRQPVARFLP